MGKDLSGGWKGGAGCRGQQTKIEKGSQEGDWAAGGLLGGGEGGAACRRQQSEIREGAKGGMAEGRTQLRD